MANVDNPSGFVPYDQDGNTSAPMHTYKFKDAADIAAGDAVMIDGGDAGYVKIALANSGLLLGVAAEPATGGTESDIAVYDSPNTIFVGQCDDNSAQDLVNTACDIIGTTGVMQVDENATTEDVIFIVGLHPNDDIGANGRVLFKIHRSLAAQLGAAK